MFYYLLITTFNLQYINFLINYFFIIVNLISILNLYINNKAFNYHLHLFLSIILFISYILINFSVNSNTNIENLK